MTEIRDPIYAWELLKDHRMEALYYSVLYLASAKKYEEILQSRINLAECFVQPTKMWDSK